jgi:hypothetical protein
VTALVVRGRRSGVVRMRGAAATKPPRMPARGGCVARCEEQQAREGHGCTGPPRLQRICSVSNF